MSCDISGVASDQFYGCKTGFLYAHGFFKMEEGKKKVTVLKNIQQVLSWIPVLGCIIGISRIVSGSILINQNRTFPCRNCKMSVLVGVWSVMRGAAEVLTFGLVAPINVVVDIICTVARAILNRNQFN